MTGWHLQTQTSACQNVTDVFYGSCSVANSRPIHLKWIKQKTQEEHQFRGTQKFTAKVKCLCLLFRLPEKESFSLYFCSSVSPPSPVSNIRSLYSVIMSTSFNKGFFQADALYRTFFSCEFFPPVHFRVQVSRVGTVNIWAAELQEAVLWTVGCLVPSLALSR